ncbi:MAG: stage 0 sporulation family protein [Desulfobacterales bacterium]|nr:stage 0 sporulation family protein [Desulfobacterales bacterium]
MSMLVGVKFKRAGKLYHFSSGELEIQNGDIVIVETDQGVAHGRVLILSDIESRKHHTQIPLKEVLRVANEQDTQQIKTNTETEQKAFEYCIESLKTLDLKMNLFAVESTFDASKLTFYFTADGRVDFRQLVKVLVKQFRVRIEMRQVGIRNQAKMCGGVGRCGVEICCATFLDDFEPVSIRMAKEQGLSLNPTKISGLCGRLMCCLNYEYETYCKLKEHMPQLGEIVAIQKGKGTVMDHHPLTNQLTIQLEGEESTTKISMNDILSTQEKRINEQHEQP